MHNGTKRHLATKLAYESNPKHCIRCQTKIPYEKRRSKHCDHSCAARISRNRTGTGRYGRYPPECKSCGEITKTPSGQYNVFCVLCIHQGKHLPTKEFGEYDTDASRKRYLLRTRPHKCESCGLATWLKGPIPLEMDHIDGDSDNNIETNLRLICPNCHALSPFAKGRNRGRGRTRQRIKTERYQQGLKY